MARRQGGTKVIIILRLYIRHIYIIKLCDYARVCIVNLCNFFSSVRPEVYLSSCPNGTRRYESLFRILMYRQLSVMALNWKFGGRLLNFSKKENRFRNGRGLKKRDPTKKISIKIAVIVRIRIFSHRCVIDLRNLTSARVLSSNKYFIRTR